MKLQQNARERILVTGAAGFIGAHVAQRLVGLGYDVTGLDNLNNYYDPRLKRARLEYLCDSPHFAFHEIDIADEAGMRRVFEEGGFRRVIHLAAQAGVRYSLDNPRAYVDSNVVGFLNILEGVRRHNCEHLVFASSSSVYGANTSVPFCEADRTDHPVSLYAATKKSNELFAHAYSHLYGVPMTGLRFFTVYGPWGRPDMAIFKFVDAILAGKSIQQEFGHTINALLDAGKQIVVAGDRLAGELEALDERIRSRLGGGLVVEVGELDEALRAKILATRLEALQSAHPNFQVSPDVVAYVARVVATNGRDLDGAANRLLAHATLSGQFVTLETAEAAIRDLVRTREPRRVKIEDIQKLVATRYNVSRADILSERRTAAVVKPRQIAMYLSKALTPRSLPEIGRRFGGRDHTTVLHAVRKIEKAISEDRSLHEEVDLLKRMLQE